MHFGFINIILLYSDHQPCFGHSCGHLQGGKCKNTNIFIVCWDHSMVKKHVVLVRILVKW